MSGFPHIEPYLAPHRREVEAAAARIAPYVRRTPLLEAELNGQPVVLKCEAFQPTGSFKVRGAFNAVLQVAAGARDGEQPAPPEAMPGVAAVSSGNHAQAVALAARTLGLRAVILIPEDANPQKIAATRALGAEVVTDGVTFANRDERLGRLVAEEGLAPIHPFDDWDVIHGQGTAALEVLEERPDSRLFVMPVGGGGLASGTALIAKALAPDVRVVAVEPAAADDAARSWNSGTIQRLPRPPGTIADGVRTVAIGTRTFEVMVERRLVDAVVTVLEEEIEAALVQAWLGLKLALEPTAALPLAALLSGGLAPFLADTLDDQPAPPVLILTGGNFDPGLVARLLSR